MADFCKILIVDDEYLMRQGLKHMIDWETEGFQIVGDVSNGLEALNVIEEVKPHIVLCDIVMPVMDGMEFSAIMGEKHPEIKLIILSGYDNFDYVKNTFKSGAVDYVLKPTLNPNELLAVLQKTAKKIPGIYLKKTQTVQYEKNMERYLLGYENEIDVRSYEQYFMDSKFLLCGAHIKKYDEQGKDVSGILYNKIESFGETFSFGKAMLLYVEEKNAILILNFPMKAETEVKESVKQLARQLSLLYERMLLVIGETLEHINQLRDCYRIGIIPNLEKKFYYKKDSFLEIEKQKVYHDKEVKLDYNQFSNLLGVKRYNEAMEMLINYVALSTEGQMDENRLKNQSKNMIFNLLEAIAGKDEDLENYRQDYFGRIDVICYAEDFLLVLDNIKEEILSFVQGNVSNEDETIGKIMDYIVAHYNENLDLNELARVFNFSYSYLSSYFNQHISEGFSGYLNRIRIENACKLLRDNQLSIAEVGENVGYGDQSYFCRVFKKMTGKSPSAWKREQRLM